LELNITFNSGIADEQITKLLTSLTGKKFKGYLRNNSDNILDAACKIEYSDDLQKNVNYMSEKYKLPFIIKHSELGDIYLVLEGVNTPKICDLIMQRYQGQSNER